jgi:hypothetical protein
MDDFTESSSGFHYRREEGLGKKEGRQTWPLYIASDRPIVLREYAKG